MDKVIIGIATIEERKESLFETLVSLDTQADEIHVFCNDYKAPKFKWMLDSGVTKIKIWDNEHNLSGKDLGDRAKFFPFLGYSKDESEYHLVCDDDLIYPPDYVQKLVASIEKHKRTAVIGYHGKTYYSPVDSYYRDLGPLLMTGDAFNYRCLNEVIPSRSETKDWPVTIIGTGCAGWHNSLFTSNPITLKDMPIANMADIWLSKKCQEMGIKRFVQSHYEGWIKHSEKVDMTRTISTH